MARTDAEIMEFYESRKGSDWLGTIAGDLFEVLPFEAAKPFLKDGVDEEEWGEPVARDDAAVIERMRSYMGFAWEKALGHRGISAGRSIDHFRAWLFLVGDDELLAIADDDRNYPMYGVPVLAAICEKYGFDVPDDEAVSRMARGLPCEPGCWLGCGR